MGLVLLSETVPEEVTEVAEDVLRTVPDNEVYLTVELCYPALQAQFTKGRACQQVKSVDG